MDFAEIIEKLRISSRTTLQAFEKQCVAEVKETLRDRTAKDLSDLLNHWRAEVKLNNRVDEISQAKRWEANRWVDAIEELLREPASKTEAPKPDPANAKKGTSPRDAKGMIKEYVETVKKRNRGNLTLDDLEDDTRWSKSTWQRTLDDEAFQLVLIKELRKRYDSNKFAPSDELKTLYRSAIEHLDVRIEDKAQDIMSTKSRSGKPRRSRSTDLDNIPSDSENDQDGDGSEDENDYDERQEDSM